jgi:hypothetical protein
MKASIVGATVLGVAVLTASIPSHARKQPLALLGERVADAAAERTILITPDTKYVNVEGGETVKFVVGNRTFAWSFNGALTVEAVELNRIFPVGTMTNKVTAYVAPDPRYLP